jgi:hypothetical protein
MAQLETIFKKVFRLVTEGKLKWKSTGSENAFETVLGDCLVRVTPDTFGVFDQEGNLLDEHNRLLQPGGGWAVERLFELAREKALGVDEKLERFSKQLDEI